MKIFAFECNFVVAFIFKQRIFLLFFGKSAFGLLAFLRKGDFFHLMAICLFSAKLCSAQKFMIGYNMYSISMDISNTHSYTMSL